MRLLLAGLALLAAASPGQGLALQEAPPERVAGAAGAQVVIPAGLDAWDAGEPAHLVELRWLGAPLPGAEARMRPARGSAPWLAFPAAGVAWSVGPDFRASTRGWDGQEVLELRFTMPAEPGAVEVLLREAGEPSALALRVLLAPDAPPPPGSAPQARLAAGEADSAAALWAPPREAPAPTRAAPGPPLALPISLAVAGLAGRSLLARRQP